MDTTAPSPTLECPVCAGPSRVLSTVTNAGTTGFVYRCGKCQHKTGRLDLGPDDPPETHAYVRRKLNRMLKPLPKPAAR